MSFASSPGVRARMQRQRRQDTAPELALRRALHGRGLRYRVQQSIPGTRRRADLVFGPAKVAVFVDGCFWHQCPEHATEPRSNHDWWAAKLAANVARDRDTDARLRDMGWLPVHVWEHEEPDAAAARVADVVASRRVTSRET